MLLIWEGQLIIRTVMIQIAKVCETCSFNLFALYAWLTICSNIADGSRLPISLASNPNGLHPWFFIFFFDSRQTVDDDGLTSNNLEYQFVNNDEGRVLLYSNESDLDNCAKDSWWLEAIKVADNIESKPERLMLNDMVSLLKHFSAVPSLYHLDSMTVMLLICFRVLKEC